MSRRHRNSSDEPGPHSVKEQGRVSVCVHVVGQVMTNVMSKHKMDSVCESETPSYVTSIGAL